jgi:hypothetical protein
MRALPGMSNDATHRRCNICTTKPLPTRRRPTLSVLGKGHEEPNDRSSHSNDLSRTSAFVQGADKATAQAQGHNAWRIIVLAMLVQ